jgi:hypothetical protein
MTLSTAARMLAHIDLQGAASAEQLAVVARVKVYSVSTRLKPYVDAGTLVARRLRNPKSGKKMNHYSRPGASALEQGVPLSVSGHGDGSLGRQMRELAARPPAERTPEDFSIATAHSRSACRIWAKKLGITINTRKDTGGRIRVWRTA